jgi:hypothetical protein
VKKKHLPFIRDMHINTGFQFEKVDSSNKMELLAGVIFFFHCEGSLSLKIIDPSKEQWKIK